MKLLLCSGSLLLVYGEREAVAAEMCCCHWWDSLFTWYSSFFSDFSARICVAVLSNAILHQIHHPTHKQRGKEHSLLLSRNIKTLNSNNQLLCLRMCVCDVALIILRRVLRLWNFHLCNHKPVYKLFKNFQMNLKKKVSHQKEKYVRHEWKKKPKIERLDVQVKKKKISQQRNNDNKKRYCISTTTRAATTTKKDVENKKYTLHGNARKIEEKSSQQKKRR